jgi:hypothetical protein
LIATAQHGAHRLQAIAAEPALLCRAPDRAAADDLRWLQGSSLAVPFGEIVEGGPLAGTS